MARPSARSPMSASADRPAFGPAYGFGAYIHWPYCTQICPYCDFNVYAAKTRDPVPLLSAMIAQIKAEHARLPDHPKFNSVFFGGGTPSLLSGTQIDQLITALATTFGLAERCEITLEANPNDISLAKLGAWKQAGINRLSIGLQSLSDDALTFLGRDHTSDQAKAAIALSLAHIPSVSIDMIYARPGHLAADWQAELNDALSLGAHHLSLYELTIEPNTPFGKREARGKLTPLPDDHQATLYELTDTLTQAAGLPAYEISNHAINTQNRSVHNQIYWNSGDWLGIGPGAHGRLSIGTARYATETQRRPADYISAPTPALAPLTRSDTAQELLAMGLRPADGIDRARLEAQFLLPLDNAKLKHLREGGWLTLTDDTLALTPKGRLLADHITFEIANAFTSEPSS